MTLKINRIGEVEMEKRRRGRPNAFPPCKCYSMFCTPEEAKILREALKRRRKKKQLADAKENI